MQKPLILASGSPRRKALLALLGYDFEVTQTHVEERQSKVESALGYVNRLSKDKAQAGLAHYPEALVIGADTIVVCDNQVLEKPNDFSHARHMLMCLSGRSHQVITSVTLAQSDKQETQAVSSTVWFKPLLENEIEEYWQTGEPVDKAGSYGIQGVGGRFVTRLEGSYHAVVGLPLYETDNLLKRFLIENNNN